MGEDIGTGEEAALRLAGSAALGSVIDVGDPQAWVALDAGVREDGWYGLPPRWEQAAPLPADLSLLDESRLALALCHRDGRIREAAMAPAARCPGLLPLIVVRCADWAAPVREYARRVLVEALDVDAGRELAPLILLVGRRERGAFAVGLLADVLRGTDRDCLAPLLGSEDRGVRRFAYRFAVDGRFLTPAELARAAAGDHDKVVQDLCAEAALAAVREDGSYDDVLGPLLGARSPQARSAGVTALRAAGRPERAGAFLTDRSALVRACARYVVRQAGDDPLPRYRQWCADPADPALPPGAAIGLAECGERADAELLWPLLGHPAAPVRARAVAGLRVLDVTDVPRLRALLDDPAPGVVRQATEALLPSAGSLDADWLAERLGTRWPRPVRMAAFRLVEAREGLVRLRAALSLVDDEDEQLRHRARQSVRNWRFAGDLGRAVEVGELLERARHLLGDDMVRQRGWEAGLRG